MKEMYYWVSRYIAEYIEDDRNRLHEIVQNLRVQVQHVNTSIGKVLKKR